MDNDPFDTLGLEPRFDLSAGQIERAWLARMANAHPDVADSGSPDIASRLNRAKGELEDAERRANALLHRLGGASSDEDKSLPDGFLAEIFGVREDMEQRLDTGGEEARRALQEWAEGQRRDLTLEVGELFTRSSDHGALAAIRQKLNVWRYIERMIEQLDPTYDPNIADFR